MELVQQCNSFDVFWDEVLEKRDTINTLARMNETIDNYNYDKIEKQHVQEHQKRHFFPQI